MATVDPILEGARMLIKPAEQALAQNPPNYAGAVTQFTAALNMLMIPTVKPGQIEHFITHVGLARAYLGMERQLEAKEQYDKAKQLIEQSEALDKGALANHSVREKYRALHQQLANFVPDAQATVSPEERRQMLLQATPFQSLDNLVLAYNHAVIENDEAQRAELYSFICESFIPALSRRNPTLLLQSVKLLGCNNPDMVKILEDKLLEEIEEAKLAFPAAFEALTSCLHRPISTSTATSSSAEGTDLLSIADRVTQTMNTLHAPDIQFTCTVLNTLYETMYAMLRKEINHVSKKTHQDMISKALTNLSKRLEGVKYDSKKRQRAGQLDDEDAIRLDTIRQAIEFGRYALAKLDDEKTPHGRRIQRLKVAGMLLLQAADAGFALFNAAASGGAGAVGAVSQTLLFFKACFKQGRAVYRHYHNQRRYCKAYVDWQKKEFELLLDDNSVDAEKVSVLVKKLSDPNRHKDWHHPQFQWSVINSFMSASVTYQDLRPLMADLLLNYYNQPIKKDNNDYSAIRRYALHCLHLCQQQGYFSENETLNKQLIALSKAGSRLSDLSEKAENEMQLMANQDVRENQAGSMTALARIWGEERFSEDLNLFNFMTTSKPNCGFLKEQLDHVRSLKSGIEKHHLSIWGKAVLATFKVEELVEVSNQLENATFEIAVIGFRIMVPDAATFKEMFNSEQSVKATVRFISAGAESVEKIKINDSTKAYLQGCFDKLFNATVAVANTIIYSQTTEGARLTIMNSSKSGAATSMKLTQEISGDSATASLSNLAIS